NSSPNMLFPSLTGNWPQWIRMVYSHPRKHDTQTRAACAFRGGESWFSTPIVLVVRQYNASSCTAWCDIGQIIRHHLLSIRSLGAATVGTPVTRRPPYRPGRAVFPHPVPRLHSLPRRVKPCLLEPAGRLAHLLPVRHVRDEFPFRATCFRRDL